MRIDRLKLRIELAKRDMTALQLAELSGVSRGTISYILAGKSCSDKTGFKICKALGMDPAEFIKQES